MADSNKFFEVEGYLFKLFPVMTFESGFKKREFVVELRSEGRDGVTYKDLVTFEVTKDWMHELDGIGLASKLKVSFLLGGKAYTPKTGGDEKYFNFLKAWKIEALENTNQDAPVQKQEAASVATPAPSFGGKVEDTDDLPF